MANMAVQLGHMGIDDLGNEARETKDLSQKFECKRR